MHKYIRYLKKNIFVHNLMRWKKNISNILARSIFGQQPVSVLETIKCFLGSDELNTLYNGEDEVKWREADWDCILCAS